MLFDDLNIDDLSDGITHQPIRGIITNRYVFVNFQPEDFGFRQINPDDTSRYLQEFNGIRYYLRRNYDTWTLRSIRIAGNHFLADEIFEQETALRTRLIQIRRFKLINNLLQDDDHDTKSD